ncbi:DUF3565 domain-containing protein [Bdellovibrio sp. HCB185ZH]|uniref:DUF3565 domain-containing protein n=1 Tax=Bdellovibrio sp. HCB185ZH TaxID=3394235 RepID=UPI0039A5F6DE
MNQSIVGYLTDSENHWVAKLECGHVQHVRHDPPWMVREWVLTAEGREKHLGIELDCKVCDELAERFKERLLPKLRAALNDSYESAGISGLCEEGRWEVAVSSLENVAIGEIIHESSKSLA